MKKIAVLAFALASLLTPAAFAGNLLSNSGFDSNIAGWPQTFDYGYLTTVWNRIDSMSSPSSGSITMINSDPTADGSAPRVSQCVAVTSGLQYDLGAKMRTRAMQENTGVGMVGVSFYADPACAGSYLGSETAVGDSAPTERFVATALYGITAPSGASSALVFLQNVKDQPGGSLEMAFDDVYFGPAGSCVPDRTTLCLNSSRFRVRADFSTSTTRGHAHVEQLTSDSGYLWFFQPTNVESIVKVLRACAVNQRQWVFAGGLTDVQVTMEVTDMANGETVRYSNPLGTPFAPIQDTNAFTCP